MIQYYCNVRFIIETITESKVRTLCITFHRGVFAGTYLNKDATLNISVNHFKDSYHGRDRVHTEQFLVTDNTMNIERKLELVLNGSEDGFCFWIKQPCATYSDSRSDVINTSNFFNQCSEGTKYWIRLTYGADCVSKLEFSFAEVENGDGDGNGDGTNNSNTEGK